jgi:two-component system sensor kinase FixL
MSPDSDPWLARPHRPPDYELENRAIAALTEVMARAPEELPQRLVETALTLCRAGSVGMSILEQGETTEAFLSQAVVGQLENYVGQKIPRQGSLGAKTFAREAPLLVEDPKGYSEFAQCGDVPIQEVLSTPFHRSGKPIGILWIAVHESKDHFDGEDQRLLVSLARIASAGHQITHALSQLHNEVDAIMRLHELGRRLIHKLHVDRLLDEILNSAIAIAGADCGTIQLLHPSTGELKIVAHRGFPQWWLDFWSSVTQGHGSCGTALLRGERIIVEDIERSPIYAHALERDIQRRAGVRAVQSTPLISRSGKVLGMFSTHYKTLMRWDERSLRLLDLLAWQASELIDRTRADEQLYDREARLQAILKTATDAIISIDETGTIESVNPATERMFGYNQTELIGRNIKILMPNPFRNEHDAYLSRYLKTGERRIIGRSREASGRRRDGTIFPIELSVAEIDGERKFTGFIRDVTERKNLQRHLLNIVAEEQQRISCELHDGIQQELTGLSLFAGVVRQTARDLVKASEASSPVSTTLDSRKRLDALRLMQDASDRLTQGLADTHRHVQELAHGIMPVPIDAEGLRNALDSMAKRVGPNIACRFDYAGDVTIVDNNTASHVFRIAQESLTNAIRHGNANSIQIRLKESDGKFILEIEDNGSGFDPFTTTHGMGLRTMEYRASLIGGILQFERSSTGGVIVRCVFPRHLGPTNHDLVTDPLTPVPRVTGEDPR